MAPPAGDELANRLNDAPRIDVSGTWFRHVPIRYRTTAVTGLAAYGRWSQKRGFPVIYLGEPRDSVVAEAYRHLVDKVADPGAAAAIASEVAPRVLVTCHVEATHLLDLTHAGTRLLAGLDMATLTSDTADRDAYSRCQIVAATAHQLAFHGLLAPAATRLGRTLALFPKVMPDEEMPTVTGEVEWDGLPPDPRSSRSGLRLIKN